MKIAFITVGDPTRLTGGYLYHARLFAGLRARGMEIDEIVVSKAALIEQLAASNRFAAMFDPLCYGAVVIDALARGVVASSINRWQEMRPVVVLVHQLPSVAEANATQIASERALEEPLLRADRLVAVSEHGRQTLIERGASADRITVVSPGFDRLPVDVVTQSSKQSADHVHALCVAQWIPRKGITTLVEAWIEGGWSNAQLELIGEINADPAYTQEIQRLIDQAPVGSIRVRGTVDDEELSQAYQHADLFVLPSRFEGYGMVYAEALAQGLPIVACDVGPVPDLVTPGAGLFVPPNDPAALRAALDRLINDRDLRRTLAAGARQRAAVLPSWHDTVIRFQRVLEAAITQRSNRLPN